MINIISLSGGKDSTAMLLIMLEKKIPVDHIVFFDTGWEFPRVIEHINKIEKYIGKEIVRLKPRTPLNETFKKRGFPNRIARWCMSEKRDAIIKFNNKHKPNTQWIGFGYDEAKRIKMTIGYNYPLVDWKITEDDALKYCYEKGFDFGGYYKIFKRQGCWCCPLQSLKDLKSLWLYFPEYWQRLIDMQKQSKWQFRMDYTLEELDERFRREEGHYQLEL